MGREGWLLSLLLAALVISGGVAGTMLIRSMLPPERARIPVKVVGAFWKREMKTERRFKRLVRGFAWERVIQIEKRVRGRDTGSSLPDGAKLIRKRVSRETTESCTKAGSKRERKKKAEKDCIQVPVTRTSYEYEYNVWMKGRVLKAVGKDREDREPSWPKVSLGAGEREGASSAVYRVLYVEEGVEGEQSLEVDESRWRQLKPGDELPVDTERWGPTRTLTESSQGPEDFTPRWPEVLADERVTEKSAKYILHLRDERGLGYSAPVSEAQWHQLAPGGSCTVVLHHGQFFGVE
ncbi:hypothetical protein DAT35_06425 [Vitiosangium sp. GDMCC 1.1324]|nr:hypothetical protein DAT35_06425 [Vitiosangium sp. GDMCC 1.1324]